MDIQNTIQDLSRQVKELTSRVHHLDGIELKNRILQHGFSLLTIENAKLRAENTKLKEEVETLKLDIEELKSRLNSNSGNSSRPPSSDGYQKKPAFPRAKNGKIGGKIGHQGRALEQTGSPDKIVICAPNTCSCGHEFTKVQMKLSEKRQVFDLPKPKLEITEYQIFKANCPMCGLVHKGIAPQGVNAPTQYGDGVKSYATLLNIHYKLPFKKIQSLFKDLFGYPINESTIYAATQTCYDKLQQSEEIIKSKIIQCNVVHADETGLRVAGNLHWLHTASTQQYTYLFIHKKRGQEAITSDKSILERILGWLIHDCWASYFNLKRAKHGLCGAHIVREFDGLIENQKSKWAKVFKVFFINLNLMPFEQRVKQKQHIEKRFDSICKISQILEPPAIKIIGKRGRQKRTKGRNLLERLIREKDAALAFAFNKDVPFTNNLAERDIRPAKVKQKISNCFRTTNGADIYARIEGFISTTRKANESVYQELFNTFVGQNFINKLEGGK
jgi:transposase